MGDVSLGVDKAQQRAKSMRGGQQLPARQEQPVMLNQTRRVKHAFVCSHSKRWATCAAPIKYAKKVAVVIGKATQRHSHSCISSTSRLD